MLKEKNIVIIGTNHQASELFSKLLNLNGYKVIKVIDPSAVALESLKHLDIDTVINTSEDPHLEHQLQGFNLKRANIINGHCAQLLFCTGVEELKQGDFSSYREKVIQNLHEIKRTLYFTTKKEEVLKTVLDLARRTLDADSGSIMLLNKQRKCLTIEMADGLETTIVRKTVQKLGSGVAGIVAKTGRGRIICGKESELETPAGSRNDLVSSISAPLVIGTQVVGVININSKRPQRVFQEEDLSHLKRLADFTADIIQTSKDYESRSNYAFCRSIEDGIDDILSMEQFPFLERISLLLLKISNTFKGEICNFYHFDRESREFILKASSAISRNLSKYRKIKLNQRFTDQILGEGNGFGIRVEDKPGIVKWYLAEPYRLEGEIAGLVFLHKISGSQNLEHETRILRSTAAAISEKIKTSSQEERTKLETIKYSALSELAFELASARDLRQLSKLIVSNACLILGAETSVLSLYDEEKNEFVLSDFFSLLNAPHTEAIRKINDAILLRASKLKDDILVIDKFDDFFPEFSKSSFKPQNALCKCLSINLKIIGAITLFDKNDADLYHKRTFNLQDRVFFSQFCSQSLQAFLSFSKCCT
ncbi:MAG: GAF domain-containing protein [Chitinispirillaceae bacterium]